MDLEDTIKSKTRDIMKLSFTQPIIKSFILTNDFCQKPAAELAEELRPYVHRVLTLNNNQSLFWEYTGCAVKNGRSNENLQDLEKMNKVIHKIYSILGLEKIEIYPIYTPKTAYYSIPTSAKKRDYNIKSNVSLHSGIITNPAKMKIEVVYFEKVKAELINFFHSHPIEI